MQAMWELLHLTDILGCCLGFLFVCRCLEGLMCLYSYVVYLFLCRCFVQWHLTHQNLLLRLTSSPWFWGEWWRCSWCGTCHTHGSHLHTLITWIVLGMDAKRIRGSERKCGESITVTCLHREVTNSLKKWIWEDVYMCDCRKLSDLQMAIGYSTAWARADTTEAVFPHTLNYIPCILCPSLDPRNTSGSWFTMRWATVCLSWLCDYTLCGCSSTHSRSMKLGVFSCLEDEKLVTVSVQHLETDWCSHTSFS